MTRATTWTNSDGLIVGFGRHYAEREDGGVVKTEGGMKEARLYFDYNTPTTVSPHGIVLPAESLLVAAWVEVGQAWATSDAGKIEIGYIGGDVDALVDDLDEQAATGGTANSKFYGDGPDIVATTDTTAPNLPISLASETRIGITKTNNFTAGTATLVVRYI
jgi:hypothetical protein